MMQVSIVIPAYNEQRFIEDYLRSVYAQDYPDDQMEVIVVDGNSQDRTAEIIREKFPEVMLLHNPRKIVPISMNIGIAAASGRYLIRLDVHCTYPKDYFSRLVSFMEGHPEVDNVGGVCRTLPANNTPKAQAIAVALSSKFGMGNSEFRVGVSDVKEVDTVPFGCYRREVFEKIGGYDEELIRNQDNELNSRLKQHGGANFPSSGSYHRLLCPTDSKEVRSATRTDKPIAQLAKESFDFIHSLTKVYLRTPREYSFSLYLSRVLGSLKFLCIRITKQLRRS